MFGRSSRKLYFWGSFVFVGGFCLVAVMKIGESELAFIRDEKTCPSIIYIIYQHLPLEP